MRHRPSAARILCSPLLLLALFASTISAPNAAEAEGQALKYSIMVREFDNRAGWQQWGRLRTAWSTILTDQLNQTGRFVVIGEESMRQESMEEQGFAASGATAQSRKGPTRGQLTPAQLLVRGVITDYQSTASKGGGGLSFGGVGINMKKSTTEIRATLYIVDSSTGALVASTSVTGEATSRKRGLSLRRDGVDGGVSQEENDNVKAAMADAIEKGVKWMAGQIDDLPWRGTVVAVRGEKIYIDRGEREGVEPGLQLTVGESEVIRSHDTGEILDEIVTERGRLEITEVNSKSSVGKVISGDPTLISEGMGIAPAS